MTPQELISTLSSVFERYLRKESKTYKKFTTSPIVRIRPNGIGSSNHIFKNIRKSDFSSLLFKRVSETQIILDSYFGYRSAPISEDASVQEIFDTAISLVNDLLNNLTAFQIIKALSPIYTSIPYIGVGEPKIDKNFIYLPEEFYNRNIEEVFGDLLQVEGTSLIVAEKRGSNFKVYDYELTLHGFTCTQTQEDIEAVVKSFKQALHSSTFYENNDIVKLYYLKPHSCRYSSTVIKQFFSNPRSGLNIENAYFEESNGQFDFFAVGTINRKPMPKELCVALVKVLLKSAAIVSNDANIFKEGEV